MLQLTNNQNVLKYGVPQGNVLGPILFILDMNTICNLKTDEKIATYTDDTCLFFSADNS